MGKGDECRIQMKDKGLSEKQFSIFPDFQNGGARIKCCSSEYLTMLQIEGNKKYILTENDYIALSDTQFFVVKECFSSILGLSRIKEEIRNADSKYIYPRGLDLLQRTEMKRAAPSLKLYCHDGIYIYIYI